MGGGATNVECVQIIAKALLKSICTIASSVVEYVFLELNSCSCALLCRGGKSEHSRTKVRSRVAGNARPK